VDSDILVNFGGGSGFRRQKIAGDVAMAAIARHAIQSIVRVRKTSLSMRFCILPQTKRIWWFR
jgi:hypothetical protein